MDYVDFKWKNSTKQSDRLPEGLQSDYINIDERTFEDLVAQMAEYARSVKFYEEGNLNNYVSDWRCFFEDIYQYEDAENNIKAGLKIAELERLQEEGNIKPHMALMLSFLKMYQLQQQNLNRITERHLDYYYKEMLGFTPKQGTTGKVIVFPTINKKDEEVVIPKGTLFDAGKDANGGSIYYASANELTVSKAKVSEAKYIDAEGFVAQLPLTDDTHKVDPKRSAAVENTYGFAITSSHLEQLDKNWQIRDLKISDNFIAEYTTEKGWVKLTYKDNTKNLFSDTEQIISKYDSAIHGEGFNTEFPVIRFILDNPDINIDSIKSASIFVDDSENLTIENAYGKVENKIGAQPFGAMGKSGDFFVITPPEGAYLVEVYDKIQPVHIEKWKRTFRNRKSMLNNMGSPLPQDDSISCTYQLENDAYDQQKAAVSLAIKLAEYAKTGTGLGDLKKTNAGANQSAISDYLIPPIPNFWDKCHIDYQYNITNDFEIIPFTPFGVSSSISFDALNADTPIFKTSEKVQNKGTESLCFAIEKIKGDCVLNIYFGIDDTNYVKPAYVFPKWSYKNEEGWSSINETDILFDTTNGLDHSGIISFRLSLPSNAEDLIWFKVENPYAKTTEDNYLSVVKDIRTHGLELFFSEESKGQPLVGDALPANSISKMVKSIVGIKSIEQPFDGDKGSADETEEKFRCRVSERLRHKGKAINKWDYERLVLEKFPQVAEAKCMPSYGPITDDNGIVIQEFGYKPGSVLLLVSPEIDYQDNNDSLRPKMGNRLLCEIQQYMDTVKPPFVELLVTSLSYVPVKVDCTIKLKEGYNNANYYKSHTNDELVKFIAPWSDKSMSATMTNDLNVGDILSLLESLEWVDAVTALKISLVYENTSWSMDAGNMADIISPNDDSNKISVLTSVPNHDIKFELK